MRFGDVVELTERNGIAIRVGDEIISVHNIEGFGSGHEILGWDLDYFAFFQENCRIRLRKEGAARRPGELEFEWVV